MKAIVQDEYGPADVLKLADIDRPVINDDEVLVQVRAASTNPLDWHFMRGTPYLIRIQSGLRRPKTARLGVDVSGQVEAVGKDVTLLSPGDEVFGVCKGAFAEYAHASEDKLVCKPADSTFAEAATVPVAALTALQALRDKGHIHDGQKVLINGASGGVGTFAVQLAKFFGAVVTGVCSATNVEMVRSIGADYVVDYTTADFTESGERYDLILDCVGSHSLADTRRALTPTGTLVLIGGPDKGHWLGPLISVFGVVVRSLFTRQKLLPFLANINRDDLHFLKELLDDKVITPVIDRMYPLSETAEAIRYLEAGHAKGKVVITI